MTKNYAKSFSAFLFAAMLCLGFDAKAQQMTMNVAPGLQCQNSSNIYTLQANASTTLSSATGFTWSVQGSTCGYSIMPGVNSATIFLFCPGNYVINCTAINSSFNAIATSTAPAQVLPNPVINVTANPMSPNACAGTTFTMTASGAMSYTWNIGSTGATAIVTPTASTCYSVLGQDMFGCIGMGSYCPTVNPLPNLIVTGPQSVCAGSSANFSASGAVTYSWITSPAVVNNTVNILQGPGFTTYTMGGTGSNGCKSWTTFNLFADTTCANVWPGDANSDGIVNSTDVFEIGLSFNSTGAPRSSASNAFTSQQASSWIGIGSTFKNRCHIDCNGDGTINMADTVAIFNNFSMTHAFKPAAQSNGDLSIVVKNNWANDNVVYAGQWNKADILIGSSANPLAQLYGLTFDVSIDQAMIEPNSFYLVYTPSFLNANNQNVQFKKMDFTNAKAYGASVRTDMTNTSGFGKIAELWFKVKADAALGTDFNLTINSQGRVSANGALTSVSGGTAAVQATNNLVGINKNQHHAAQFSLYPNPANGIVVLQSSQNTKVDFSIVNLLGQEVANGTFTNSTTLDISGLQKGSYLVALKSEDGNSYKKLVIE